MSRNLTNLINDAVRAGYLVETDRHGSVTLKKNIRVNQSKKTRVKGLVVGANGWAYSLDVLARSPGVAAAVRSYKDMRAILEIGGAR